MSKTMNLVTTYYAPGRKKEILKINKASNERSAVMRCVDHMQMNDYGAYVAEVVDHYTGELHAVVTHSADGRITIVFRRDPKRAVCVVI
jgi:hypothetical protein